MGRKRKGKVERTQKAATAQQGGEKQAEAKQSVICDEIARDLLKAREQVSSCALELSSATERKKTAQQAYDTAMGHVLELLTEAQSGQTRLPFAEPKKDSAVPAELPPGIRPPDPELPMVEANAEGNYPAEALHAEDVLVDGKVVCGVLYVRDADGYFRAGFRLKMRGLQDEMLPNKGRMAVSPLGDAIAIGLRELARALRRHSRNPEHKSRRNRCLQAIRAVMDTLDGYDDGGNICHECGCTSEDRCLDDGENPCAWTDESERLCSFCAARLEREKAGWGRKHK